MAHHSMDMEFVWKLSWWWDRKACVLKYVVEIIDMTGATELRIELKGNNVQSGTAILQQKNDNVYAIWPPLFSRVFTWKKSNLIKS